MANQDLRSVVREACRPDERACVADLTAEWSGARPGQPAVVALATMLVDAVRQERRRAGGVDNLMHEFSLSSQEGIALMCLAEALLRIPDTVTRDRLIRDKIGHGDWQSHLGAGSLFVNAATWGLMLTGKLVAIHSEQALGSALTRLLSRGGEPLVRKAVDFAMRLLGQQFVMGQTIAAALARSAKNVGRGYTHSFDMLGEAALTAADAERYGAAYASAIHAIGRAGGGLGVKAGPGISVKLSALHPRYQRSQRERVMAELRPRLSALMRLARQYDIGLNIDAEEADRLDLSLDLLESLAGDPELAGWDGMGFVVQAYQKRCPAVIDWLADLARKRGRRLMVRLVKGAYWDSEIKRAQVDGLSDYPVFTRKAHTDLCYLVGAGRLLANADVLYPQFATHNARTLAEIFRLAFERGIDDYEFQCLHGMGEALYDHVVGPENLGRRCRIYAPVGSHETLLPYLVRRLLENGANSSFVNQLVDPAVPIADLVADPASLVARDGGGRHPAIALPRDLYGPGRINSAGVDLADEASIAELDAELRRLAGEQWLVRPLIGGRPLPGGQARSVWNPADCRDRVGGVVEAGADVLDDALARAAAGAERWFRTPAVERAAMLLRAADQLERHRPQLVSLCIREAGKTWANALGEVREAVDFCRYYGQRLIAGDFDQRPVPGPVVCISPWNFPLAIFVGQVSAALAAGSPVLAKPAEQTPLVAGLAVELLLQAGIPGDALQLLPGRGETVGAALVGDERVRGVLFTGSTEVARDIARRIAPRDGVRLIAETGGQNAMIVDSSALPEQVVQDVLVSGFDSAGQRCSALRVLCLQRDIADRVLAMLKAAMRELTIGDPACLATDIGPVIDPAAGQTLLDHVAALKEQGAPVYRLPLPVACAAGSFVPPTLIEIGSIGELAHEVFGPVVHVLRFDGDDLDALVDAVNATGYGLTLGIHSRIDETVQRIVARARVGNIYVNRNMVGAVVGVQPFGGEGLSGTGPKAGGPLYLHRLADSRQVDAAAVGGHRRDRQDAADELLNRLEQWAASSGRGALARHCGQYRRLSLRHVECRLPGPTGESNTLHFAPRGAMLCLADDEDLLLDQLAAVLATGNRPRTVDPDFVRNLLDQLPDSLAAAIECRPQDDHADLAGVLFAGPPEAASGLRRQLADRPGALIALYRPGEDGLYPLYRMLAERVVCINTTAAGGNTTLMTLGPGGGAGNGSFNAGPAPPQVAAAPVVILDKAFA